VPTIDIKNGRVVIELPAEIEGDDDAASDENEDVAERSSRRPGERRDP
jgi:16S rRNA processing protein RimM